MSTKRRQRNTHFTFKKFHIDQKDCAMKVSSDSCLFGASIVVTGARRILDIGTGTGLLALMMAQRAEPDTLLDAVEVCPLAAATARRNFASSPFASMINLFESPIQRFSQEVEPPYDLIVANPPFYQNALQGKNVARNLAWHAQEEGLDFPSLLLAVKRLLKNEGTFWILLPPNEMNLFSVMAKDHHLHEFYRIEIKHKSQDQINRVIGAFSAQKEPHRVIPLTRCMEDGVTPSAEVRRLLANFMLHY